MEGRDGVEGIVEENDPIEAYWERMVRDGLGEAGIAPIYLVGAPYGLQRPRKQACLLTSKESLRFDPLTVDSGTCYDKRLLI